MRDGMRVFGLLAGGALFVVGACTGGTGESSETNNTTESQTSDATEGTETTDSSTTAGGGFIDEDATIEEILGYASNYVRITELNEMSQHGLASTVHVYVQPEIEDLFRAIDPETHTPETTFPEGSIIVKEHLDDMGAFSGLTVMAKAAEGYNPEQNDWWWARFEADMSVAQSGVINLCFSCHDATNMAAPTDYVVGVPAENQT